MIPTITAGIVCFNEENFISPCIEAITKYADQVIVTDGDFYRDGGEDPNILTSASSDETRFYIEKYRHLKNLDIFYLDGLVKMHEKDFRNTQLQLCDTDYFLLVDADEIWDGEAWEHLLDGLKEDNYKADYYYVGNRLFFWNPECWCINKLGRVFKNKPGRTFVGLNEISDKESEKILWDPMFAHYGYIDKRNVERKLRLFYSDGWYRGCGTWWYENIYLAYDGTNEKELFEKNYGTLHPWGKIYPGFAAQEFTLIKGKCKHPIYIRQYFDKMGWDSSNTTFIK